MHIYTKQYNEEENTREAFHQVLFTLFLFLSLSNNHYSTYVVAGILYKFSLIICFISVINYHFSVNHSTLETSSIFLVSGKTHFALSCLTALIIILDICAYHEISDTCSMQSEVSSFNDFTCANHYFIT